VFARLEVHPVSGADDLDRPAAALAEPETFGDVDRLAERMGVPGGPRAGGEVHSGGLQPGWLRRRGDRVDVDGSGEPVTWARGGLESVARDLHRVLLSGG